MNEERKWITHAVLSLPEITRPGWILDLGGGGEGVIGQMYAERTVSIDRLRMELEDAPSESLKIIMDACDLQFLDNTFHTAAAFFFLFFTLPDGSRDKIFSEVLRVLKPGGEWWIWDANLPPFPGGEKDLYVMRMKVSLPGGKVVETGYGMRWNQQRIDSGEVERLARAAGFEIVECAESPAEVEEGQIPASTFFMRLRKPAAPALR